MRRRRRRSALAAFCPVSLRWSTGRCPSPRLSVLWVAVWLTLALGPGQALALHRDLPFLLSASQRPGTNRNASPSRGDPHWVSFESSNDLLHTGSTGQQIFVWNSKIAAGLECQEGNVPGPALRQITRFAGGSAHPATSSGARVVAFDSTADLIGNGSRARKIFVWTRENRCYADGAWPDPSGGSIAQITNGGTDCIRPSVNANGDIITFECQGPRGPRIFVYNPAAPPPRPTLLSIGEGTSPQINHDGSAVVFESDADLPSDVPMPPGGLGFRQIYAYNVRLDRRFRLTSGVADSINPSPGQLQPGQVWPLVAFQSRADLLQNGSSGWQIFLFDPDTGELRQITRAFGESTEPSLGGSGDLLAFLSTEDLLGIGTFGQHIFFFDLRLGRMFEIASSPGASYQHPKTGGGNFILFESTQDMFRTGASGSQVYLLDTWGRIPKPFIGQRLLRMVEGGFASGSRAKVKTRRWHANAPLPAGGQMIVNIDLRDSRGEAPVAISQSDVIIPPIRLPDNAGMLCIKAIGDGTGTWDCDGGRPGPGAPGGDVLVTWDHAASNCAGGCVDSGGARTLGDYKPGGMLLSLPVRVAVTQTLDGGRCPADVTRYLWSLDTNLLLTSGTATANVFNADGVVGETLDLVEAGAPFECRRMQASNFAGATLVAVLPVLRVPAVPDGSGGQSVQDIAVSLRLQPYEGRQYKPCNGIWCDSVTTCRADSECNDGNACNGGETCSTGLNSVDNADLCLGRQGCTDRSCVAGPVVCDDEDACNGVETCDPATGCTPGTFPTCDDGALCTEDFCDPIRGCVSASIPMCCRAAADCTNNTLCDGDETCTGGDCVPGTPTVCTDGNACNGQETCDPTSATCMPALDLICDDGNVCTDDSCNTALGCTHAANANVFCDDGNPCTVNDTCMNGLCSGTPVSCDNGDACDGFEFCDPSTGACVAGLPPFCDDGNPCTDDGCDSGLGCLYTNNSNACSDGSPCTTGDICFNGICTGSPVVCEDSNVCNGIETCNPNTGSCQPGSALVCDDGNSCTDDTCHPVFGCLYATRVGSCDDGNRCTTGDTCENGICAGTAVDCDNGNICDGLEFCDQLTGNCLPGDRPSCDDGKLCTTDVCDPTAGCLHVVDPNGTLCLMDTLAAELGAANPADLGGPRRKQRLVQSATRVRTELAKAAATPDPAVAGKRYRAASRGLNQLQQKLRKGIFRWNFDLALANNLISEADVLMVAVQGLMTPP